MFNGNQSKEQTRETTEQFLARGGKIDIVPEGRSYKHKRKAKSTKIDAQALLNKAVGTPQEKEVVAFLKSQGITVE